MLYNQLNNALTSVVRNIKMDKMHSPNERYQVDVNLFAEVGVNWATGINNKFADWYNQDLEKVKCVAACNEYDKARTFRHQPPTRTDSHSCCCC